jgi:hypothetical protein
MAAGVLVEHRHRARLRRHEGREHLEKRGLAATVRSETPKISPRPTCRSMPCRATRSP